MVADGWTIASPVTWVGAGAVTAVKATVLLLAAAGVARLLERRSAALRHSVWTSALAATLLLPVLAAGLPERVRIASIEVPAALTVSTGSLDTGRATPGAGSAARDAEPSGRGGTAAGDAARREQGTSGLTLPTGLPVEGAGWILTLLWAGGAGLVLAKTAVGSWRLRRIGGRADRLGEGEWRRHARAHWRAMGGKGSPRIRVSPEISAPLTFGVFRPTLLLPQEALDTWSRSRTEAVLVHELAHLRRRDTLTQLVGRLACAAYWFHPLVWHAERAAAVERERACDDTVLRSGARASDYARHLMATAREAGAEMAAMSVPVVRGADLEGRVQSVLGRGVDRRPVTGGAVAGTVLPAVGITVALATLSVDAAPGPAEPEPGGLPGERGEAAPRVVEVEAPEPEGLPVEIPESMDPDTRSAAAGEVGRREPGDPVERLTEALQDPSAAARREAAEALAVLEDPSAVGALRRALVSDSVLAVRKAAAWALGETESEAAVAVLAENLGRADGCWLDQRIARALGETRQPSAVPVLRGLLDSSDPGLRRAAVEGLMENDTDRARSALDAALRSDDPELRTLAADVLGRAG